MLQGPQRRTWFEPELLGERLSYACVGAQRVGLAAAAVQRSDQRGPQPLAQRVPADERFELGDDLSAAPEIEPRRELVLDEPEPSLLEPDTVRGDPLAVAGVGEDITVEHRQRRGAPVERRRRIATGPQSRRLGGQAEHVERVDRAGLDVQHVPGSRPGQERPVAERPAQPRHLQLQRVAVHAHGLLGPQVLDQPLRTDHDARVERQPDQQLGRLARPHRDRRRHRGATRPDRAPRPRSHLRLGVVR